MKTEKPTYSDLTWLTFCQKIEHAWLTKSTMINVEIAYVI